MSSSHSQRRRTRKKTTLFLATLVSALSLDGAFISATCLHGDTVLVDEWHVLLKIDEPSAQLNSCRLFSTKMASSRLSQPELDHSSSPPTPTLASNPYDPNSAAYLAYPVKHVVSSIYRRMTEPPEEPIANLLNAPGSPSTHYTAPKRTASPFSPPPLTPLTLSSTSTLSRTILNRSLAEEIRLLVPSRLQLVNTWRLAYSLEADGASLTTLYKRCHQIAARSQQAGYVVVVRDTSTAENRALFGAYLSDPPKPALHYYGTGECFLWKANFLSSIHLLQSTRSNSNGDHGDGTNGSASVDPPSEILLELAGLPPPPSSDTTHLQRSTFLRADTASSALLSVHKNQNQQQVQQQQSKQPPNEPHLNSNNRSAEHLRPDNKNTATPDRIRFKAFPYRGINEFMVYCEANYISIGGGDGHYGLWLDDRLERGISDPCPTFGNERLSDEGPKFDILGLEVWYIGA